MWGAKVKDLIYSYYPENNRNKLGREDSSSYLFATRIWKYLPDHVSKIVGPKIRRPGNMLNCPSNLGYSATFSAKRLKKASDIFGENTVKRIIGFALFILGANREEIAGYLKIPSL